MAEPSQTPGGDGPLVPTKSLFIGKNIETPDPDQNSVTGVEKRDMPFDGVVSKIFLDIPPGVQSEAGFNIKDNERGIVQYPYDEETEYASFNDVSGFWPVTFPMEKDDEILVNFINQDDNTNVDFHFIKVWVVCVGIEALPYTLDEIKKREGVDY